MRVLIADPVGTTRAVLRGYLARMGFQDICEAGDGLEAWNLITGENAPGHKRAEMVFADWDIPVTSGYELLKKTRSDDDTKKAIFILLVDEEKKEQIMAAAQAGVDECVVKPGTMPVLRDKLLSLLRRKLATVKRSVDERINTINLAAENPETDTERKAMASRFVKQIMDAGGMAPFSYLPWIEAAKTLIRFQNYEEAEKWLRNVIAKDFSDTEAHQLLGHVLKASGRIPQSIEELEIAIKNAPDSGAIALQLGESYMKDGQMMKAIEFLGRSVMLFARENVIAQQAKSQNSLGKAKFEFGEAENDPAFQDDGIQDMNKALELDPGLIAACYNLMVAYKKTGLTHKAMEMFEQVRGMEPKDAGGWLDMGKAFLENDEQDKAVFAFKKADQLSGGVYEIYEEAASALYRHKMHKEALRYLEKAKKINPSDKFVYNLSGVIHRMLGDRFAAVNEYQMAAQLDPNDPVIVFNLGVAYFKTSQEDRSLEYFKRAKRLDPSLTEADKYLEMLEGGAA
jgi:two-component system chemotaxis response regulator CheY